MAETRGRREPIRTRPPRRPNLPQPDVEDELREEEERERAERERAREENGQMERSRPDEREEPRAGPPNGPPNEDITEETGFDADTNARYEEVKRGGTHIIQLQQMTMQQLMKTAKDEGIQEYTGLKKQDLIFKILKERVKQNGLMFGEGTLEVLPDG